MIRERFGRATPTGSPLLPGAVRAANRADLGDWVARELAARLSGARVHLHQSGRAALRALVARLSSETGRNEVIVPSYTCYSVPAAVVAAGLTVRLVDVDERGWIAVEDLAETPFEKAAAIVVCNLFGIAEPVAEIVKQAREAGVAVVDDAAQALGASDGSAAAGARGDFGLMSFGRGKPLCALGGGAVAESRRQLTGLAQPLGEARRLRGWVRALLHDVALLPWTFRLLSAIPSLEIGVTHFDPDIEAGPISGDALALLASSLETFESDRLARAQVAEELARSIAEASQFVPLTAEPPGEGAYPRLALMAPTAAARDVASSRLCKSGLGPSELYPQALCDVEALSPYLAERRPCRGGRELAQRILTLPTHERVGRRRGNEIVEILTEASRG